ncbi:hypothetical protein CDEST_00711 [Colletotrichum destructivum]|uniref:Uncharacterized protein n=1 Tax=Colletotrichum destructivum TaxID=34406 RepID=A0AAX4HXA8_9PEZI|nr:hypothetical protein CDEST_00711 [Colletotrichum destructivum]
MMLEAAATALSPCKESPVYTPPPISRVHRPSPFPPSPRFRAPRISTSPSLQPARTLRTVPTNSVLLRVPTVATDWITNPSSPSRMVSPLAHVPCPSSRLVSSRLVSCLSSRLARFLETRTDAALAKGP